MSPDNTQFKNIQKVSEDSVLRDIENSKLKDDYIIRKLLRYSLLAVAIMVIFVLSLVFLIEVIVNKPFRDQVLDLIKNNITAIVIAALAILGINLPKKDS